MCADRPMGALVSIDRFMHRLLPPRAYHLLRTFTLWPRALANPEKYSFLYSRFSYCQDGLATFANCDFMNEPQFAESYRLGKETGSWGEAEPAWRAYVLCWAATRAAALEGDFVECGVNKGGYSRCVMNYVRFESLGRTFWLLDTFSGLSEAHLLEEERTHSGVRDLYRKYYNEDCLEAVKETFSNIPNVEIIKGTVPETLPLVKAEKIAYLSIDMNCVLPEIEAAEFFWDKLVPGAAMVLDDYGWPFHGLQKSAFDLFSERKGVPILALPTGQGLLIKP